MVQRVRYVMCLSPSGSVTFWYELNPSDWDNSGSIMERTRVVRGRHCSCAAAAPQFFFGQLREHRGGRACSRLEAA